MVERQSLSGELTQEKMEGQTVNDLPFWIGLNSIACN